MLCMLSTSYREFKHFFKLIAHEMNVLQFFGVLSLVVSTFAGAVTRGFEPEFVQCGGTITSDAGRLSYPEPGQVIVPGQVCVWTIHLETKDNFRLTLRDLSVGSDPNNINCNDEGLRFYSLTNLVAKGDQQNYIFCHQYTPETTFFLSNSLATVVFYTSNTTELNSDTGFSVEWTGMNYDPLQRKHSSSFSSTSSGVIKFPVVGAYPSNLVASWLISQIESSPLDINLESIVLEGCENEQNTCTCDALILFEISSLGQLVEKERFCSSSISPIHLGSEGSTFLLAFFTDGSTSSLDATGFELVYYPRELAPTTAKPPNPNNCGDIVIGSSGTIVYSPETSGGDYDSCLWTVRAPDSTAITFTLPNTAEFNNTLQGIYISGFFKPEQPHSSQDDYSYHNWNPLRAGRTVTLRGSVAVVALPITQGSHSRFELNFEGNGVDPNLSNSQDIRVTEAAGIINFPQGSAAYLPGQVTTFAFPFLTETGHTLEMQFELKGLESNCQDHVRIYWYDPAYSHVGLTPYHQLCSDRFVNGKYNTTVPSKVHVVVIFIADDTAEVENEGFVMRWNWKSI